MSRTLNINSSKICIREIQYSDSDKIQTVASLSEIADTMISIPHPYPDNEAKRFVAQRISETKSGNAVVFVLEKIQDNSFCGLIEVRDIDHEHLQGELSFWLAPNAWGKGYMSKVIRSVLDYSFTELELNRLYAYHMERNPASGKVLARNGFQKEGILRQRVRKWGKFEDVSLWACLQQDWQQE